MPPQLCIKRLTPAIGAEIGGVDLSRDLADAVLREIHATLMQHGVVFFRDQKLDPLQQQAFAARFGRLRKAQRAAFEIMDEAPAIAVLINDADRPPNVNHYHTDGIFRAEPEFASMLRAVDMPETGGDTIWVSLAAAFDGLSSTLQETIRPLRASNDFMKLHGSPMKARSWDGENAARMEAMRAQNPPVVHPLVKRHPVTGREHLYLSESFTTHVEGLSPAESEGLLGILFKHCAKPEYQCRFNWRPNSMALWDNRATLHYAVADYWPARRLMHRVTIETDGLGAQAAAANRMTA